MKVFLTNLQHGQINSNIGKCGNLNNLLFFFSFFWFMFTFSRCVMVYNYVESRTDSLSSSNLRCRLRKIVSAYYLNNEQRDTENDGISYSRCAIYLKASFFVSSRHYQIPKKNNYLLLLFFVLRSDILYRSQMEVGNSGME